MTNERLTKLGFQTTRALTQLAEALAIEAQAIPHDRAGTTLATLTQIAHCSDRAEHVCQLFLEGDHSEEWIARMLLMDVRWMTTLRELDWAQEMLAGSASAHPTADKLHRLAEELAAVAGDDARRDPNREPGQTDGQPFRAGSGR